MRTLYTLFALISLALVAMVATAAPPTHLSIDCTLVNSVCQSGPVTLIATGLNPKKSYIVTGVVDGKPDFSDAMTLEPDGTFILPDNLLAGSWTFTLYVLDHTLDPFNPQREVGSPLDVDIQ